VLDEDAIIVHNMECFFNICCMYFFFKLSRNDALEEKMHNIVNMHCKKNM
jgi:hypothetical protein